jgi:diguanylate cyclase
LLLLLLTNNVTEAFEMLACHEVGVALCDQRMPEMPRVEFLSKIRKMYPDTVRMLTGARENLAATREAIDLGAIFKFIAKPWGHDQLKALVEEAFQSYRRAHKKIS